MKTICPLINEECREHGCTFYARLQGINPQTGVETDEYMCTIVTIPLLLIENSKRQIETGAAVESFRNEMVAAKPVIMQIAGLQQTALEAKLIE